jgi:hypothetical protein
LLEEEHNRLREALAARFGSRDAPCLAQLLAAGAERDFIRYGELDLQCPDRDEHILALFEERVLLPIHRGAGSSWGEKSLRLEPGESYFMPPVARRMVRCGSRTGRFDALQALSETLAGGDCEQTDELVRLIAECLGHARSLRLEAGLLVPLARSLGLDLDLHDAVDQYVVQGILSPCKGVSQASGLAWYEINGCLFWDLEARR